MLLCNLNINDPLNYLIMVKYIFTLLVRESGFWRHVLKLSLIGLVLGLLVVSCFSDLPFESKSYSSPRLNVSDSLAMVNIYKAIGPWGGDWDLKDIHTWGGVEAALDLDNNEYRIVGFQYYNGRFHGYFPEDFRKLTELRKLAVCGGTLSGGIPSWIGELKHLQYLALGENRMSGEIPEEIGNLVDLQKLVITHNLICGELPESLGNLVNVYRLTINHTLVEGEIPKSLKNMSSVEVMDLNNNRLSGRFPIEILRNERLAIDCTNNYITELPFEVWKDDFVGAPPILAGNMLNGTLPDWIFETKKWDVYGTMSTDRQKKGYGYKNFKK